MTTAYIGFGNISKFKSWLKTTLNIDSSQVDLVVNAFLEKALPNFVNELRLSPDEIVSLEKDGIAIQCSRVDRILEIISAFRYGIPLSTLFRFASWGISEQSLEIAKKFIQYVDPPDSVIVASAMIPVPSSMLRSNHSLAGREAPFSLTYLNSKSTSKKAIIDNNATLIEENNIKETRATAFGDIGGFRDWLAASSELPTGIKEKVPTDLANALLSAIKEGSDRTQKMLRPDKSIGIGTDGVYLVSSNYDLLLRLIIWVQSYLACEGVSLSPWALHSGIPRYNKKIQPSGDDYFRLLQVVKRKTNGEIFLTADFIKNLTRPELLSLIESKPIDGERVYKVLWWEYPFRMATRQVP